MCGRLVQDFPSPRPLAAFFGPLVADRLPRPRFNVCPGQPVAVLRDVGAQRRLDLLHWGLVPPGAVDPASGLKRINARAETVAEREAFRGPFAERRCVIPASGFYEWRRSGRVRQPFYFHAASGEPLALAGLWEVWRDPRGQPLESFTILTVPSNALVAPIHARMPALLSRGQVAAWLDPAAPPAALRELLRPYGSALTLDAVSPRLNDGRVDDRACLEPVPERQLTLL